MCVYMCIILNVLILIVIKRMGLLIDVCMSPMMMTHLGLILIVFQQSRHEVIMLSLLL